MKEEQFGLSPWLGPVDGGALESVSTSIATPTYQCLYIKSLPWRTIIIRLRDW